jgi:hypothetical protein
MEDTIDRDALREQLARLACRLRGLDADYIAAGATVPAWRSQAIADDVQKAMSVLSGTA